MTRPPSLRSVAAGTRVLSILSLVLLASVVALAQFELAGFYAIEK